MRRRNNHFLEQLQKRREAATEEAEPKAPEPEEVPNDPAARAEYLSDELANARAQLAKEQEKRQQAERRAEQQARPSSLRDFLRMRQIHKRRTWR
jgi:hypothetical protein